MRQARLAPIGAMWMTAWMLFSLGCSNGGTNEPDCVVDDTAEPGLVLNELMAKNAVSADLDGESHDWIEVYNPTDRDVDLCGWHLTNDLGRPTAAKLHESIVPAGGFLVLWLVGEDAKAGPGRVRMHLRAEGGEIGLTTPGGEYSDQLRYGEQATDFSAARAVDGGPDWEITWHVTPGEGNASGESADADTPGVEEVPAAGDLSERIMGYDEIPVLEILIDDEGLDSLRAEPREFVRATLKFDNREYGPVGLRLKGQNSFQPIDEKPSFRINIDEFADGAKFWRMDDLTLNNMDNDFSMMHERLSYMVARQLGPASRANHALVYVNGQLYGLYANVETVKSHMMARWFEESDGPLFEASDVDFSDQFIDSFELESGEDERRLLRELSKALAISDPDAAIQEASKYIHLEQFWSYWAMCALVGQFDAYPYSDPGDDLFVYADPVTDKLYLIPWGMDETFYAGDFEISQVASVLAKKCAASTSCFQGFADTAWGALDMMDEMELEKERQRVAEQIAPLVRMDERKPYSDAKVEEFQMHLFWFIDGRRAHFEEMLPPRSGS